MSDNTKVNKPGEASAVGATRLNDRRNFLKMGGTGIAAAIALGGLGAAKNVMAAGESPAVVQQTTINFGTGDIAIGNYAYLLEQLEADFYIRAVANLFSGATAEERQLLTDVRDHEIIHREFFKAFLGANAIPTLTFDFSLVNFNSRDSVLTISQILEDTGVSAYNGAAQAIQSPAILEIAGKIVSVEARHAAAFRDLRIPRNGWFGPHSEDFVNDPLTVLNLAAPFIPRTVTINPSGLPRTIVI
jgi:rubrerythrin